MNRKITALKAQKKDSQRVNVYLDNEFAFGLSRIVAAWLYVGQELSAEKINELIVQDDQEKAYQAALKFLNFRSRSESEVRRFLEKKNVNESVKENVLGRLRQGGLLNDSQFARSWVENRNEFHPRSKRALAYELRLRGIDDGLISQVLDPQDDENLAYQAACKRARRLENLGWDDFRRKLSEFLARRGFPYEVINPVVKQVWNEREDL